MEFDNIVDLNEEQILNLYYDVIEGNPERISYDAVCMSICGKQVASSANCRC